MRRLVNEGVVGRKEVLKCSSFCRLMKLNFWASSMKVWNAQLSSPDRRGGSTKTTISLNFKRNDFDIKCLNGMKLNDST